MYNCVDRKCNVFREFIDINVGIGWVFCCIFVDNCDFCFVWDEYFCDVIGVYDDLIGLLYFWYVC